MLNINTTQHEEINFICADGYDFRGMRQWL